MFRFDDLSDFYKKFVKGLSKDNSVIVVRLEDGTNVITPDIKSDSSSVRSTENGLVLSQEEIDSLEGLEYLFIPEGSLDNDDDD